MKRACRSLATFLALVAFLAANALAPVQASAASLPREYGIQAGYTTVGGQPTPTLQPLALSAATFVAGDAAGTAIGTVTGRQYGSTLAIFPADSRVALDGAGNLKVGSTPSVSGTIYVTVRETLLGANGSPRDSILVLSVTPASMVGVSDKKVSLGDGNKFWVTAAAGPGAGKGLSVSFLRNTGADAGNTPSDTWRIGPAFKADNINQLTNAGGYASVTGSDGASDYVMGVDDTGGGVRMMSVHGNERDRTVGGQKTLMDGVAFDPTSGTPTGKKFEIIRDSDATLTGGTLHNGETIAIKNYHLVWEKDNKIEQSWTVEGGSVVLDDYAGVATNAFVTPRYTQLWSGDGATLLKTFTLGSTDTYQLPTTQTGTYRMVDPLTGDYMIWTFEVAGRTIPSAGAGGRGILVNYDSNYQKLFVKHGYGVSGTWSVTQTREWFIGSVASTPATIGTPFTNFFNTSSLSALWKVVVQGNTGLVVSGGELQTTGNGTSTTLVHPLNPGAGTYRVEIDYLTGGSYTGGSVSIARSDGVSTSNPLVTTATLPISLTQSTWTSATFTIANGETPWLRMTPGGTAGRTAVYKAIRLIKIS